jgi:predicted PurR-regulated permease PerM
LGIGVILGFYYNFVLLEPILWTLFGVLFSYVALFPPKVKIVRGLVYLLIPSRRAPDHEADDNIPGTWPGIVMHAIGHYLYWIWRMVTFLVVPSVGDAPSNLYFSVLYRLMFVHLYSKTVLRYFPGTTAVILKIFALVSIVVLVGRILHELRVSALAAKRRKMKREKSPPPEEGSAGRGFMTQKILTLQDHMKSLTLWFRVFLARLILPQAHLLAAVIVMFAALAVVGSLMAWTVYAFSDEVMYMYRNIANVVRMINAYLSHFSSYTMYVDKAYSAASEWITSQVMADSASAKSRDLYNFISFVTSNQKQLSLLAPLPAVTTSVAAASAAISLAMNTCITTALEAVVTQANSIASQLCKLEIIPRLNSFGNATRVILSAVNQDLDAFLYNPYSVVDGFWELTEYYQDELKSGGTISKGGDYLLTGLSYLKDFILRSGSISLTALGSGFSIFAFLFDSVLQAVIFITALFLLLQSNVGFYQYTAVLLHFVDPSTMLYRSIHRALRAILISSIKMAFFHAGFVWLLYSYSDSPLVCIPTVAAFVFGLVPVVSPVMVAAIPLPIYAYANGQNVWAIIVLSACFVVWWSVGTAIYAEIPDSSVWMTTFSVGLGISLFGPRGVIIGPAIATIPFALYGIGSAYISGTRKGSTETSVGRFFPGRLHSTPRASHETAKHKKGRASRKNSDGGFTSDAGTSTPVPLSLDTLIVADERDRVFDFIMNNTK